MKKKELGKNLSLWESLKILFSAPKGFWLINMVNFSNGIAYFGILILLTRFLATEVGMNDVMAGISFSSFTGLVTIFMFFGGFVTDKIGVRRTLTLSLILALVGRILLTVAPMLGNSVIINISAWTGIVIYACGSGFVTPALFTGIKEYTNPQIAAMGYGVLYSIMNMGVVMERFISPFIRTDTTFLNLGFIKIIGLGWGIGGVFWTMVMISAVVLLAHMTLFTKQVEKLSIVTTPKEDDKKRSKLSLMQKIKKLPLLDGRFMFFVFMVIPVRTLFAHRFLTMPDYIFRSFSETVSAKFEWITGLNPLIIVIFVPIIATITRRVGAINVIIVGTAISALTTFILVPNPNLTLLLTYMVIFSLGEAVWAPRFFEYIADMAPAGKIGTYIGFAGIPLVLAKATTGLYSGLMLDKFIPSIGKQDSSSLWLIYALIACATPIGLMIGKKWMSKNKHTQ